MRTLDARFLNQIANDPRVRPFLLGRGVLDLTLLVENPANVCIVCSAGGILAVQVTPQLYEFHTVSTLDHDGVADMLQLGADGIGYLFSHTTCREIVARVPVDNRNAHIFATHCGFRDIGLQREFAPGRNARLMRATLEDWIAKATLPRVEGFSIQSLIAESLQFAVRAPDNEQRDRYLGAALLMAKSGQVLKGVEVHNLGAFIYGFPPITLLSQMPTIIDIGDAVVGLENGQAEVMLCRTRGVGEGE